MKPDIQTQYVFTITAEIAEVMTAGDPGMAFAASFRSSGVR